MISSPNSPPIPDQPLAQEADALRDLVHEKSQVIQSQKARIAVLEELLQLHKQKQFGRHSEQQPDQGHA